LASIRQAASQYSFSSWWSVTAFRSSSHQLLVS
jgi:hypothetical protein